MVSSLMLPLVLACTTIQASAFLPSSITQQQSFGSVSTDNNNNIKKEIVGCRREKASSAVAAATSPSPGEARNHGPPAGGESAPTAGTARAPSYRRLYDAAMQLLQSELQLEPYPIPAGLEGNSAVVGKGRNQQSVKTSITAFQSTKFRQIRAALVETDGLTQVLNFVMFPSPSYDLPIFGADLVSLPGVHLVCIDLQPAHPSQELHDATDASMHEARRRHLDGLPWGGDLPEAAQKFFSRHCLWAKLGPKEEVEQRALDAMMDYLREYLRLAEEAEPLDTDGPLQKIAAGHADYSNYRRENDPARGMLTRFYGADWTESAIEGILFDFKG